MKREECKREEGKRKKGRGKKGIGNNGRGKKDVRGWKREEGCTWRKVEE